MSTIKMWNVSARETQKVLSVLSFPSTVEITFRQATFQAPTAIQSVEGILHVQLNVLARAFGARSD